MLRRLSWSCLLTVCTGLGGATGCRPVRPAHTPDLANTSIAQGERFEVGSLVYDEYFATVHELHSAVATAELEERDARTTLATMLNLIPIASEKQVLRKLRDRAETLPSMALELETAPTGAIESAEVTLRDAGSADESTKNLVMVMEATANANLNLAARMSELPERSHRMHSVGKALMEGCDEEFADQPPQRRQRIRRELEASLEVLVLVANASRNVEKRARAFVAGMQDALSESLDNEGPESVSPPAAAPPAAPREPAMPEDFNP